MKCAGGPIRERDWERARRRAIARALHSKAPLPDEWAALDSYCKRLERARELALWLWEAEPDWFVTVNSNDERCDYQRGRAALRKLGALVDRYLLGKNWAKFESRERTLFFAVPEHAGGELHYHILLKLPPAARHNPRRVRRLHWSLTEEVRRKKIFSRGDGDVVPLTGHDELSDSVHQFGKSCYLVKALWRADHWENFVVSTEFHARREGRFCPADQNRGAKPAGRQVSWATA